MFPLKIRFPLQLVDLGSENEITFGQTVDFVRPSGDFRFSPGKKDIRVMPLRFGDLADLVDKRECLPKIRELKGAREVMRVHNLPVRHLFRQSLKRLAGERRCSPPAGFASFRG